MKWEYNKKEPWLSGFAKPAKTRYVKMRLGSKDAYYSLSGRWTVHLAQARVYSEQDIRDEARWRKPNERFLEILD